MKCIEVSSPKANKKDVEIISSKVVKLFFDNFDLRRSNYFTHFFSFFKPICSVTPIRKYPTTKVQSKDLPMFIQMSSAGCLSDSRGNPERPLENG